MPLGWRSGFSQVVYTQHHTDNNSQQVLSSNYTPGTVQSTAHRLTINSYNNSLQSRQL